MRSVVINENGGPEVFNVEDIEIPEPTGNQVLVKNQAAGINFIDIYQRSGLYPVQLPYHPGLEGGGVAEAIGENVTTVSEGQKVAFCSAPGAYSEYVLVPEDKLVIIPENLETNLAVAAMLQGLTAHYLTQSTFKVTSGQTILIHAAAGGVGLLVIQMAKMVGARIIGTVSTSEKEEAARNAGADHVINYTEEDFLVRVSEITEGIGVDVVYDGVGSPTFEKGLDCLRRLGMMVSFGQSGGSVPPVNTQLLNQKGSLFLTRPSLFHYIADMATLRARAEDLFGWIEQGSVKVRIDSVFPLDEVSDAHRKLEGRKTIGKVLLAT